MQVAWANTGPDFLGLTKNQRLVTLNLQVGIVHFVFGHAA
jgi:hypothetical protein